MKNKEKRTPLIADLPLSAGIVLTAMKLGGLLPATWHMVLGYWVGLILIALLCLAADIVFDAVTGLIEYIVKAFKGGSK